MFPIKAVKIIKRLMLSRRPKRTKAPVYGAEGRYREMVSEQMRAVGTVGVNLEHGRSHGRSGMAKFHSVHRDMRESLDSVRGKMRVYSESLDSVRGKWRWCFREMTRSV